LEKEIKMKRLMLFAVLSALVPTPVLAATPPAHLGGSYLITETHFCPATVNVHASGLFTSQGGVYDMIGVATLTPSKPDGTSGTMTFSTVNNDGAIVIMNGKGAFTSTASTGAGAYSFSGTTFTITPKGQSAMTYSAFPGLASSTGVLQDLFALRLESGCSDKMILRSKGAVRNEC
jgi:hypothetical protein